MLVTSLIDLILNSFVLQLVEFILALIFGGATG